MANVRSAISRLGLIRSFGESQISASRSFESIRGSAIRCFSDDTGRILGEEERAKETMFIKKMEKEIQERKKKLAQQSAESEKANADKKPEGSKP